MESKDLKANAALALRLAWRMDPEVFMYRFGGGLQHSSHGVASINGARKQPLFLLFVPQNSSFVQRERSFGLESLSKMWRRRREL